MATKYRLQDVAKLKGRNIFFDTNILIYLFWPTAQYSFEQDYARVFNNLLKQGNNLFVDFLVISEIVNLVLRVEHRKNDSSLNFKNFRNSQDGATVLKDIYTIINDSILNRFNIVESTFNKHSIEGFLTVDNLDFIDKAISTHCRNNSLVLLTNDKDFKNVDLDILTCNPSILAR